MQRNSSFKVVSGRPARARAASRRPSASGANNAASAAIVLTAWSPGLDKVGLTQLLRNRAGLPLARAKAAVDGLLAGHQVVIGLDKEIGVAKLLKDIEKE